MTERGRPYSPAAGEGPTAQGSPQFSRREYSSSELFGNGREIYIRHADGFYTLRQTARGKLILTK